MNTFSFGNSRFGSDIAAGLHELDMIGLHDDIGGSVNYGFSYSLFVMRTPFSTEVEESGFEVDIPAGNYILSYDDQGFIDVEILDSPEAVDRMYREIASTIESLGGRIAKEPKQHRDGSYSFYVTDPDGNAIQALYEPTISKLEFTRKG